MIRTTPTMLLLMFALFGILGCAGPGEFTVADSSDEELYSMDALGSMESYPDAMAMTDDDTNKPTSNGRMFDVCTNDNECLSNYCIEFEDEKVCTKLCSGNSCPEGWDCKTLINSGADVVRLCIPLRDTLCGGCENNTDCGIFGDQCIQIAGRSVCGRDCSVNFSCPEGFICDEVTDLSGNSGTQCIPESGICSCRPEDDGENRPCIRTSEWGICEGIEVCNGDSGWSVCSASPPVEEICDGIDNDCDNLIDEDLIPRACEGPRNDIGVCIGIESCEGGLGYVCNAEIPSYEICDGIDNDCDDVIDNDICYDGNPCTRDICVLGSANGDCNFAPRVGPCDDGDACTADEICNEDGMCSGSLVNCDDNNPCTTDSCNSTTGCVNTMADGAPCETGNLCTNDICAGGVCTVGGQVTCRTSQCMDAECRPDTGCVNLPRSGGICDDDDRCTSGEMCSNGSCVGGVEMDCNSLCNCSSGGLSICVSGVCACACL